MVRILVGTRKGLFVLVSGDERRDWEIEGQHLQGWEVFHAVQDPRDGALYAATNSFVYGPTVHRSTDLGATWTRAEELGLPEESGLKLEKTWHVEPGREGEAGRMWLGGPPGVLFRSDDWGAPWQVVGGLQRRELAAHDRRVARASMGIGDAGRLLVRPTRPVRDLPRNAERVGLRLVGRWRELERGRLAAPHDPVRRGVRVAVVLLPGMLAAEAGGQQRFELDAETVEEALRSLPISNLIFDERGELRRLVNVYVDGVDMRDRDGLGTALSGSETLRLVGAIAGG